VIDLLYNNKQGTSKVFFLIIPFKVKISSVVFTDSPEIDICFYVQHFLNIYNSLCNIWLSLLVTELWTKLKPMQLMEYHCVFCTCMLLNLRLLGIRRRRKTYHIDMYAKLVWFDVKAYIDPYTNIKSTKNKQMHDRDPHSLSST